MLIFWGFSEDLEGPGGSPLSDMYFYATQPIDCMKTFISGMNERVNSLLLQTLQKAKYINKPRMQPQI